MPPTAPNPPLPPLPPAPPRQSITKYVWYILGALLFLVAGAAAASFLPALFTHPSGTSPTSVSTTTPTPTDTEFGYPELVTIQGYTGLTEDPYITSDEKYLLWDSAGSTNATELFYAKKIDYKTFVYVGKIQGVGGTAAPPAIDTAGNLYFGTQRYYASQGTTIARGTFTDGVVTNVGPVEGISKPQVLGSMSASPSRDGIYLVFSDNSPRADGGITNPCLPPGVSHVVIATKNTDGTFTRLANSDEIMKNVNTIGCITDLSYQPVLSADNLEIFFTAPGFGGGPIWTSRRTSVTEPFGVAQPLDTGPGLSESGSISLDGKHYYYHHVTGSGPSDVHTAIYVLSRE